MAAVGNKSLGQECTAFCKLKLHQSLSSEAGRFDSDGEAMLQFPAMIAL